MDPQIIGFLCSKDPPIGYPHFRKPPIERQGNLAQPVLGILDWGEAMSAAQKLTKLGQGPQQGRRVLSVLSRTHSLPLRFLLQHEEPPPKLQSGSGCT